VNPAAGRGRARRKLPRIRDVFAREGITDIRSTSGPGDEEALALSAMVDGATTLVAVGGDGTVSRVANAIMQNLSSCRLALIPVGTGNDFAKTLGVLSLDYESIAHLAAGQSVARMDVGKVDDLYFINGVGFGIDPAVLADTLNVKLLKGNAVYIVTALKKLFSYRGIRVRSLRAHPGFPEGRMMMLTVSNGRYFGGAFRIAPEASVCDGLFDVHSFVDTGAARRARVFFSVLRGKHAGLAEVTFQRESSLTLLFDEQPQMEVDGELRSARSAEVFIQCLPGALSVAAAPGFPP